jgi:hypothetical protein
MNALVLPGLALTMFCFLVVCAWLTFRPEPHSRPDRAASNRKASRAGSGPPPGRRRP